MKGITFLLFLVLAIYSAEAGKGLIRVENRSRISYYYISHEKLDFGKSRKYCQNLGGDLVTINGVAEQRFLFNALKKANYGNAFIGYIANGNKYSWLQGRSWYKNWCKGEPNNPGVENCSEIVMNKGGCWNNTLCHSNNPRNFICEKRQFFQG